MKIITMGSLLVLLAMIASMNTVSLSTPAAFADHPIVEIEMPLGAGLPSCEESNTCYVPHEATTDKGGEVKWTNNDETIHTVTSGKAGDDHGGHDFDVIVEPGQTFQHKFEKAGSFPYHCKIHKWMEGTITVEGEVEGGEGGHGDHGDHGDHGEGPKVPEVKYPESIDEITTDITTGEAVKGEPLSIDIKIVDKNGENAKHANINVIVKHHGQEIADKDKHAHAGYTAITTKPLTMEVSNKMPIEIEVELLGFGASDIVGPSGPLAGKTIPESAVMDSIPDTDAPQIPSWIKQSAKLWAEDVISDQDYINALQFLISKGIIKV